MTGRYPCSSDILPFLRRYDDGTVGRGTSGILLTLGRPFSYFPVPVKPPVLLGTDGVLGVGWRPIRTVWTTGQAGWGCVLTRSRRRRGPRRRSGATPLGRVDPGVGVVFRNRVPDPYPLRPVGVNPDQRNILPLSPSQGHSSSRLRPCLRPRPPRPRPRSFESWTHTRPPPPPCVVPVLRTP